VKIIRHVIILTSVLLCAFQVLATGIGNVYPPSRYATWFANAGFSSLAMHTRRQGIFVGTK